MPTSSDTVSRTELTVAPTTPNIEVARTVESILESARDLDAFAIGVSVSDRVATLTGTVGSYAERVGAEELATGCAGVDRVINTLVVRSYGTNWAVTDKQTAAHIHGALAMLAHDIDVSNVRFDVQLHVVDLRGQVGSIADRALVRHTVESRPGVDFVNNHLEVTR